MKWSTNPMKRYYMFFIGLAVLSALAIVSNLFLRRGPVHDAQVVNDLQAVQQSVDNFYIAHSQLPASLSQLRLTGDTAGRLGAYDYAATGPNVYQLCATFMNVHHSHSGPVPTDQFGGQLPDLDEHIKGRQCFSYQVISVGQPGYPYGVK